MRVYVAGPYSAPTKWRRLRNVRCAMEAGLELMRLGHHPYVPHLSHWMDELANEQQSPVDYEAWLALDFEWLLQCDALLYLATSPGADREKSEAERRGIPVAYSVREVGALVSDRSR